MLHKMKGGGTLPARPDTLQILTGLIGGISGIGLVAWLTRITEVPLLMAPFGATCVLLFAAPGVPLAQPRNVVGGHFVAALVGLVVMQLLGTGPIAMAVGVGLAIALMQALRVVHPPAGANPLVVMMSGAVGYDFLVIPVLAGSVSLVLVALLLNNLGSERRWPTYWL
ncbi:HPP family protein [Halomonas getboli]|uniref:HPP family protein n=1 Tax=Halomonas getboli TaxID=2935862 RepID=UPI001FFEB37C|nr:HPP family protein [Halomonas getboli]MCK2184107.1 HPP family protein [Halomonas getboli]